jgi:hypothetical protein
MLDGELVSFDSDGRSSFDLLGRRMLMRDRHVPVCFLAFDLLAIDGTPTLEQPYEERRAILEAIDFAGSCWAVVPRFDDGDALWHVVTEQRLEGVVANRLADPYVPGHRRRWVKFKSPAWRRREREREASSITSTTRLLTRPSGRTDGNRAAPDGRATGRLDPAGTRLVTAKAVGIRRQAGGCRWPSHRGSFPTSCGRVDRTAVAEEEAALSLPGPQASA